MTIDHREETSPKTIRTHELPSEEPLGILEPVAYFKGAMPTGVTYHIKDGFSSTFQNGATTSLSL